MVWKPRSLNPRRCLDSSRKRRAYTEEMKVRTEVADFDAPLQDILLMQTKVITVLDHVENFSSAADSATRRDTSIGTSVNQMIIYVDLFQERESGLKRRLNALEPELSNLKVGCASLRRARAELDTKVSKVGSPVRGALMAVSQQSV